MEYKSQNNEAEIVINYFDGFVGNLLDIGANDGVTFSNSYDLIKLGWGADLVEPVVECWERLLKLYEGNIKVVPYCTPIGKQTEKGFLYVPLDSLLSTSDKTLLNLGGHQVREKQFLSFQDFRNLVNDGRAFIHFSKWDFITIDAEGSDWSILQQMDLGKLGCQCICIEHSGNFENIINYCAQFGLTRELLRNGENIILAK